MALPLQRATNSCLGFAVACALLLNGPAYAIDPGQGPTPPKPSVQAMPIAPPSPNAAGATPPPANPQAANPQAVNPPALSPQCDVPASAIAAPAPLPFVTRALAEHRALRILAIGSAASAGLGMSSGVKSYPVQITDILRTALKNVEVEIINRGVGGEVAQTSADRIRSEVALTKPDLVLWQLGTNDALSRVDPDEFTNVVKTTVDWVRDSEIDIVLVGLQYTSRFAKDETYDAIRKALQKIATDEKILYVRRYDAMRYIAQTRANLHLMSNDNFHLSDLGTQCMAEHVARAMIANLFVKRFRPNPN